MKKKVLVKHHYHLVWVLYQLLKVVRNNQLEKQKKVRNIKEYSVFIKFCFLFFIETGIASVTEIPTTITANPTISSATAGTTQSFTEISEETEASTNQISTVGTTVTSSTPTGFSTTEEG